MNNNNTPPFYQKLLTQWLPWLLAGFLGLGEVLELIKDVDYITPLMALLGTIVILIGWGVVEFLPIRWVIL